MYLMKDIIREGNSILREKALEVKLPISSEDLNCLKQLYEYVVVSQIDDLVKKYSIRPGVGIAAPQVGVSKRMFAISFDDFLDDNKHYGIAIVNPKIVSASEEMTYLPDGEGCLSVTRNTDGLVTPRHLSITVKGNVYDFNTNKFKFKTFQLTGYPAIVFQHEYDHLDGVLFTDKMYKKLDCEPLYTIDESEDEKRDE